jgi:hypothetical protein
MDDLGDLMKLLAASLFIAALVLPVPASAGIILVGVLAPTGNPSASGFATLDLVGLQGDLQVTYSLSSPIISGSGIVDNTHTILLYGLTIPPGSGSTGSLEQIVTFSAADAQSLLNGDLFVDIFSQNFPTDPGELSGALQVAPVPEPTSPVGLGLAAIAWRVSRRRRCRVDLTA